MANTIQCRTCGAEIYNLKARNIFDHKKDDTLFKIKTLTGLSLTDDPDLPKHICACCALDLNHAISFRERCIKTHYKLRNWKQSKNANVKSTLLFSKFDQQDPLNNEEEVHTIESEECDKKDNEANYETEKDLLHRSTNIQKTPSANKSSSHGYVPSTEALKKVQRKEKYICPTFRGTSNRSARLDRKKSTVKSHQASVETKTKNYICEQCGWKFNDSSNFKVHLLRHTGVKQFECQECNQKYFTPHLLKLHIRVRHKGEMPYGCKFCDQRFFTSTSRCRHERIHVNKRSYACKLCDKTFLHKTLLTQHEFLHTGQRPYRCDTCDISFQRKTILNLHCRSKMHQRKLAQALEIQNAASVIKKDEIDFDFNDSIVDNIDMYDTKSLR